MTADRTPPGSSSQGSEGSAAFSRWAAPLPGGRIISRRSRLWWFLRLRKAYRKHGAKEPWRETWHLAGVSRRSIPPERQRALTPIKRESA